MFQLGANVLTFDPPDKLVLPAFNVSEHIKVKVRVEYGRKTFMLCYRRFYKYTHIVSHLGSV